MKCVTRKPSLGTGRFSKSIACLGSLTVLNSVGAPSVDVKWVSRGGCSRRDELEEIGVELIFMCGAGEPVWSAGIDLERGSRDDLRGLQGRCSDRDDLVVVAVCDEGRDVGALEVLGEVRLRERLDA